jgi:hypothetical protein
MPLVNAVSSENAFHATSSLLFRYNLQSFPRQNVIRRMVYYGEVLNCSVMSTGDRFNPSVVDVSVSDSSIGKVCRFPSFWNKNGSVAVNFDCEAVESCMMTSSVRN